MSVKMTGKAGQAGITLIEVVLALTIMAIITAFLVSMSSDKAAQASDLSAKLSVSVAKNAASTCWNLYGHDGAQVSTDSSGRIDRIECTDGSSSTGRIVARLPEGVRAHIETSSSEITRLGAHHERGSSTSSGERTAFCIEQDESISAISTSSPSDLSGVGECPSVSLH